MTIRSQLAPPERTALRLGFLRLSDSAPLIMARELGLYQKYGLQVDLLREVSWANVRDKLVSGDLDAAHMLAPLPLATALGAGGMRADMITALVLSLNGNAITVSPGLALEIAGRGGDPLQSARSTATALGRYLRETTPQPELTFATVHPFSCHTFQLRLWLQAGGIAPERDVRIIVLPPEQMVDSLARGIIDGYCVGEPWNSVAVQYGVGAVQVTGHQVWNNAIEKVLGVTAQWHKLHPGTHLRLRLALMEACTWLAHPANRVDTARILAQPEYLDMPRDQLLPSLTGQLQFVKGQPARELPEFHVFGRYQAGFPWRSHGEWLLQQTGAVLGKTLAPERIKALVQQTFRTDLYREAARYLDLPCPSGDYKPVNRHNSAWELEPGIELGPDMMLEEWL
ncbi:CmpA/NrtA family ABC transporter substrate-binding protein [Kineobactrum salinum]|uniref:ABC transporter substrate-binding protein n=1 Tax=Kineobactrum salinum TaxID=2708301 RepID=A0A6C0U5R9_9GAMM|nr:CmpA/NrtA family ABC transporter substrate-binding protein [Kineobactrum salinum]QIB65755.1 ABC transporter substrate-binding protein [Kineobactrum salinum]